MYQAQTIDQIDMEKKLFKFTMQLKADHEKGLNFVLPSVYDYLRVYTRAHAPEIGGDLRFDFRVRPFVGIDVEVSRVVPKKVLERAINPDLSISTNDVGWIMTMFCAIGSSMVFAYWIGQTRMSLSPGPESYYFEPTNYERSVD